MNKKKFDQLQNKECCRRLLRFIFEPTRKNSFIMDDKQMIE